MRPLLSNDPACSRNNFLQLLNIFYQLCSWFPSFFHKSLVWHFFYFYCSKLWRTSQVPRTWTGHFGHSVAKCIGHYKVTESALITLKKNMYKKNKIFSLQTWINGTFIALQAVFCIAMDDQTLFFNLVFSQVIYKNDHSYTGS